MVVGIDSRYEISPPSLLSRLFLPGFVIALVVISQSVHFGWILASLAGECERQLVLLDFGFSLHSWIHPVYLALGMELDFMLMISLARFRIK